MEEQIRRRVIYITPFHHSQHVVTLAYKIHREEKLISVDLGWSANKVVMITGPFAILRQNIYIDVMPEGLLYDRRGPLEAPVDRYDPHLGRARALGRLKTTKSRVIYQVTLEQVKRNRTFSREFSDLSVLDDSIIFEKLLFPCLLGRNPQGSIQVGTELPIPISVLRVIGSRRRQITDRPPYVPTPRARSFPHYTK